MRKIIGFFFLFGYIVIKSKGLFVEVIPDIINDGYYLISI